MPILSQSEIAALNETASFNRWAGFTVVKAQHGEAILAMPWHPNCGHQYAGHLHAGLVSPTTGQWQQACFIWKSGRATKAALSLTDQNTTDYGNDFAIDDISLSTIERCPPPPAAPPLPSNGCPSHVALPHFRPIP